MNRTIHLGEMQAASVEPGLLEAGPTFEYDGVEFDAAQQGYTVVHNYALYFWRPYLGNTAFALWELLLSFCYGERDIAYPSISRLARMISNSDHSRAVVSGRRSSRWRAGDRAYSGALQVLQRERLVQVTRQGHGPTAHYTFRVLKALPLLRPDQVARLSPTLQRDHAAWLARYGIDAQAYGQAFAALPPSEPCATQTDAHPSHTPGGGRDEGMASAEDLHAGADDTRQPTEHLHPIPAAADGTGSALHNTGQAPRSTNNPQEERFHHWWQETLAELRPHLTTALFQASLAGSAACALHDGELTVSAPSPAAQRTLEQRLAMLVRRTLIAVSDGQVQQVRFTCVQADGGERCVR